jgi:FlaA1/EpsC-like NDP-sugar epimerase
VHDVCAAALAWTGLYWLRSNMDLHEPQLSDMWHTLAWILPLQAGIFLAFGLYRGLWRFASLPDLQRILLAAGLGAVAIPVVLVMLQLTSVVPRSVLILYPPVLIFLMAGSRFTYRIWKEHRLYSPLAALGEPVLILGAGEAGARLTKELAHSRQWRVVGLLDDDPAKQGRLLRNVSVLGPISELPTWVRRYGVRTVIIALPSAAHGVRRRVAELCAAAGLEALTVPSYEDLISGRSQLTTIRHVELDDLLGRDPVVLDSAGLREWLGDRVVLITGAGGSIGAELCRQIARYRPARLVLIELSEYALYQIQQSLQDEFPDLPVVTIVGDTKHAALVEQVLARERPSVIFHAAAYKHVPLMEETNAWQAVRNNAYGTWVIARAAVAAKVEKFVLVSTDKAVNPTNVMGASKRLAEVICQSLQNGGTEFVIVRFGNVFGSAGSVIPRFREQIARGGPVTVTHPEITRYFMSQSEATQLLLQAGLMGRGGELLVLDMGEPVRILDLARDMIRLSGADPAFGSSSPACAQARSCSRNRLRPTKRPWPHRTRSCSSPTHDQSAPQRSSRRSPGSSATGPPATPRCARGSRRGSPSTFRRVTSPAHPRTQSRYSPAACASRQSSPTPSAPIAAATAATPIASMQRGCGHCASVRPQRRTQSISRLNNTR